MPWILNPLGFEQVWGLGISSEPSKFLTASFDLSIVKGSPGFKKTKETFFAKMSYLFRI